jgi:hypothetical protein
MTEVNVPEGPEAITQVIAGAHQQLFNAAACRFELLIGFKIVKRSPINVFLSLMSKIFNNEFHQFNSSLSRTMTTANTF